MTGTIFDLIEEDIPEGKEGYFSVAKSAPAPKDNSFFSSVADYSKTFLKGAAEGLSKFGKIMGPLQETPMPGKTRPKELTESLEELLPTDEGYIQKSIRKGLGELPTALAFPGSTLATAPRAIAAGFLGEGAKELGAPEWAQTAAELTAYIGPDVTKKLLSSGKNKEIIDAARKFGLSDEEITPLIQSDFKQKWLSKFSPKRGKTEKALKATKEKLSDVYGGLQKSESAVTRLPQEKTERLISTIDDVLFEMPSEVRGKIKSDYSDLLSKPVTGESLINFWADINHNMGPGSKQLSLLKSPVKEAITSISPELSKDFEMINKLHSKYYNIAAKLKPTLVSDIISAGEALGIMGSLVTGYYPTMITILGEKAGKKLAQQMLINPRFQQLSQKMASSIQQNKFALAKKVSDLFSHEINKFDPETAKLLEDLSEEDLKDLFKSSPE